ncbi:hypothetical protein [Halocatena halophila]|uniref:hypothetical protein n=1 Tax=Halocatena halophila TaxID=2814576 RepID=UPI0038B3B969
MSFLERISHAQNSNFLVVDAAGDITRSIQARQSRRRDLPTDSVPSRITSSPNRCLSTNTSRNVPRAAKLRLKNLVDRFNTQQDGFDTVDIQRVLTDPEDESARVRAERGQSDHYALIVGGGTRR